MAYTDTKSVTQIVPAGSIHLQKALDLFENQGFDYFPSAEGYKQDKKPVDDGPNCKVQIQFLGEKTDLDGDKTPDVECFAGLVKTPAWDLNYQWNGQTVPWEELQVGDVIQAVVLDRKHDQTLEQVVKQNYAAEYTHYVYVKTAPTPIEGIPGGLTFQIFHSQRIGKIGPETSIVWVMPEKGSDGKMHKYMTITDLNNNPFSNVDLKQGIYQKPDGTWGYTKTVNQSIQLLEVAQVTRATPKERHRICAEKPFVISDPLILDLDGNGIQTLGLDADMHFDHDANGFSELTGWVGAGDGVLMLDKNGNNALDNGRELFGDYAILSNGKRATNGFEALTFYDANGDGKIDANDPVWSQLKIWQGYTDNLGYTGDPNRQGTITTLDELGITAVYLDSSVTNTTDGAGNTELRAGHFEWKDGTAGAISEYQLQRDTTDAVPVKESDVSAEIEAMPNLYGTGNVYDLHQAMAMDSGLKSLVQRFVDADDLISRQGLMNQILAKWVSVGTSTTTSRVDNYDHGKLLVLERFYAQALVTPVVIRNKGDQVLLTAEAIAHFDNAYKELYDFFYADLMGQTHLNDLYDKINWIWDEAKQDYKLDGSAVISTVQEMLNSNPEGAKGLLSEFAYSRRGFDFFGKSCYLIFRETILEIDPNLGWTFDTGGLPEYQQVYSHIWGTNTAEAMKGSLTQGDGIINSANGNDVIYGTDRNEVLRNEAGDSLLIAGGGNDSIWAGTDDDILDGGTGNDRLFGQTGNDTYIFRRGSGQDTIIDHDTTEGNIDTIFLGSHLTPDDIRLRRAGTNLILRINDTTDTLTIEDFFRDDGTSNRIEQILFMDGTIWNDSEIIRQAFAPTEGDDTIYAAMKSERFSVAWSEPL
jgi:hypothetical protein